MEFRIADTFTDSLARLSGDEQKAAKTTAFDLQLNPANPGMSFHKLDRARDKNFWSVRVNNDIRLIVHKTDGSLLLCYVGHQDKAYDWAARRKLETHPKTGTSPVAVDSHVATPILPSTPTPSPYPQGNVTAPTYMYGRHYYLPPNTYLPPNNSSTAQQSVNVNVPQPGNPENGPNLSNQPEPQEGNGQDNPNVPTKMIAPDAPATVGGSSSDNTSASGNTSATIPNTPQDSTTSQPAKGQDQEQIHSNSTDTTTPITPSTP